MHLRTSITEWQDESAKEPHGWQYERARKRREAGKGKEERREDRRKERVNKYEIFMRSTRDLQFYGNGMCGTFFYLYLFLVPILNFMLSTFLSFSGARYRWRKVVICNGKA